MMHSVTMAFRKRTQCDTRAQAVHAHREGGADRHTPPRRTRLPVGMMLLAVLFGAGTGAVLAAEGPAAYPPDIRAWSADVKAAQRDAGAALLERIDSAIESGKTSLNVEKGHYRFAETEGSRPAHIDLYRVEQLEIDFNGSTLWFEKQASAFALRGSGEITLKNAVIDWDPLPYTQGTVVGVDAGNGTVDVRLHAGFEEVTSKFAGVKPGDRATVRGALFDARTRRLKEGQYGFRVEPFWQSRVREGVYRITVRGFYDSTVETIGFQRGDLMALWLRGGRCFRINCRKAILEDITVYASPFVAFVEAAGKGPNIYRRCKILRRPGTTRLIASNADGFNSSRQENGPLLESCEAEAVMDDFVNVHGGFYKVLWQESPTQVIVDRIAWRTTLADSVTLAFYRLGDMKFVGTRTGIEAEQLRWKLEKETCLYSEETGWHSGGHGKLPFGKKILVHRVTLDEPLDVPPGTIVSCETYVGQGAEVRNCRFSDGLARGVRIQSHHFTIDNTHIERTANWAVSMCSHPGFWGEATNAHHVQLTNNTFADNFIFKRPHPSRAAVGVMTPGDYDVTRLQHDIVMTDNAFIRPRGAAVVGRGVRNLTITGNRMVLMDELAEYEQPEFGSDQRHGKALVFEATEELKVEGNEVITSDRPGLGE